MSLLDSLTMPVFETDVSSCLSSPWEQVGSGTDTRPEAYKLKEPEPPKKEGEAKK